jgi:hypothetical protein
MLAHSESRRDSNLVSWPHFVTSVNLKGGSSGGPVFDEYGRVFGINCVGGIEGLSYMARVCELLTLSVPEFPAGMDQRDFTVADLARTGQIFFDPALN